MPLFYSFNVFFGKFSFVFLQKSIRFEHIQIAMGFMAKQLVTDNARYFENFFIGYLIVISVIIFIIELRID